MAAAVAALPDGATTAVGRVGGAVVADRHGTAVNGSVIVVGALADTAAPIEIRVFLRRTRAPVLPAQTS